MNDFEKACKNVGNRFDLVLIASERMREIYRQRLEEMWDESKREERKKSSPPCQQAISEVESELINREYLQKIRSRTKKKKPKFDAI